MKMKFIKTVEFDVKTLHVKAGARYWEDTEVNGVEDTNGDLIPCRDGDYWCPIIEVETGKILNWEIGKSADVHYKVCDDGYYTLKTANDEIALEVKGYVPDVLGEDGDYMIMKIDENGFILGWSFDTGSWEDYQNLNED